MPSLPASQLADDGEADGTPVPPAYDPSSEEPLPHKDGVRKSVGPAPIGRTPNVVAQRSPPEQAALTTVKLKPRIRTQISIPDEEVVLTGRLASYLGVAAGYDRWQ